MFGSLLCKLKKNHKFAQWTYIEAGDCRQVRICSRCGEEEKRSGQHQFAQWDYVEAGDCRQVRICSRCGEEEKRSGQHQFAQWDYVEAGDCRQVGICSRCGKEEKRSGPHQLEYVSSTDTGQTDSSYGWLYRIVEKQYDCTRCGYSEYVTDLE